MHAIKDKPVVVNGEIVIRPIMVVALTYDHRLLDGREAVTFLGEFIYWQSLLSFALLREARLLLSDVLLVPCRLRMWKQFFDCSFKQGIVLRSLVFCVPLSCLVLGFHSIIVDLICRTIAYFCSLHSQGERIHRGPKKDAPCLNVDNNNKHNNNAHDIANGSELDLELLLCLYASFTNCPCVMIGISIFLSPVYYFDRSIVSLEGIIYMGGVIIHGASGKTTCITAKDL